MSAGLLHRQIDTDIIQAEVAVPWLLAKTSGDITLPAMQALYTAGDEDTRWMILTAQRFLRVPGLEGQLRAIVQGGDSKEVRIAAFFALAALSDAATVAIARQYVDSADPEIAHIARLTIETITGEGVSPTARSKT